MAVEKENILSMGRDILVSLVILGIILGSLYVFSGRWPPMVVIESGSMMHSQQSEIGVIDPGDIVIVQENQREDIVTYVEGKARGYKKYGQYGDVIVFEPDGNDRRTPIIHRPVLYLKYNKSHSFDVPSLRNLEYGEEWETSQGNRYRGLTQSITLHDYGYGDKEVTINLSELLKYRHSGYITMGDSTETNAPNYDQKGITGTLNEPVKVKWVKGKARGELPWFGTIKLMLMGRADQIPSNSWNNFLISMAVIILLPFITEIIFNYHKSSEDKDGKESEGISEEEEGLSSDTAEEGKGPDIEEVSGASNRDIEMDQERPEEPDTEDLDEY